MTYTTGNIVKGIKAGTFLILGTRNLHHMTGYQVKTVNPDNHAELGRGEMFLEKELIKGLA